jgi:hypothetical protein
MNIAELQKQVNALALDVSLRHGKPQIQQAIADLDPLSPSLSSDMVTAVNAILAALRAAKIIEV